MKIKNEIKNEVRNEVRNEIRIDDINDVKINIVESDVKSNVVESIPIENKIMKTIKYIDKQFIDIKVTLNDLEKDNNWKRYIGQRKVRKFVSA